MTADHVKQLIVDMLHDVYGNCELIEYPPGEFPRRYQLVCDWQINSIAFADSLREMFSVARSLTRRYRRMRSEIAGTPWEF